MDEMGLLGNKIPETFPKFPAFSAIPIGRLPGSVGGFPPCLFPPDSRNIPTGIYGKPGNFGKEFYTPSQRSAVW